MQHPQANAFIYYAQDKQEEPLNTNAKRVGDYVKGQCYCAGVVDKQKKGGKNCATMFNGRQWCYVSPETGSGCYDAKKSRMDGYQWSYQACIDEMDQPNCQCAPEFKKKVGGPDCKSKNKGRTWCYIDKPKPGEHSACQDARNSTAYKKYMYSYRACFNAYDSDDKPLPHPREVEQIDFVLHRQKYRADLIHEKNSCAKDSRRIRRKNSAKLRKLKKLIMKEKGKAWNIQNAAERRKVKSLIANYQRRITELEEHMKWERKRSREEMKEIDRQISLVSKSANQHFNKYLGW